MRAMVEARDVSIGKDGACTLGLVHLMRYLHAGGQFSAVAFQFENSARDSLRRAAELRATLEVVFGSEGPKGGGREERLGEKRRFWSSTSSLIVGIR